MMLLLELKGFFCGLLVRWMIENVEIHLPLLYSSTIALAESSYGFSC